MYIYMCVYWNRKQKNIEKHGNIEIIYNVENFLDVTFLRVNYYSLFETILSWKSMAFKLRSPFKTLNAVKYLNSLSTSFALVIV